MAARYFIVQLDDSEVYIELNSVINRLERYQDEVRRSIQELPWYAIRRFWILSGSVATYQVEIDALLKLGGATNMERLKERNRR